MYRTGFPGCCAGTILKDFGHTNTTSGTTEKIDVDWIKKWIKDNTKPGTGFYVIAINGTQNKVLKPILLSLNWKCVAKDMKSPNHSHSRIFLWLKADYAKKKKAPSNSKSILQKRKTPVSRSK